MRVLVLATLLCAASLGARGQGSDYCSGGVTLTTRTGVGRSHDGPGNYQDDSLCFWFIQPSNAVQSERIALVFSKFDLEYGYDNLWVIDGTSFNDPILAYLTGSDIPAKIESSGPVLTVVFQSDIFNSRAGFVFNYTVVDCPGGCSGHGDCGFDSVCTCEPGWEGSSCSVSHCPSSGCNNGTCIDEKYCLCPDGLYGGDCAQPYCDAANTMTSDMAVFSDHYGIGDYLDNTACTWLISPNVSASAIILDFLKFDLELDWDFLYIYDGAAESNKTLLARLSGNIRPPRIIAQSGQMFIKFESDAGVTASGFEARFQAVHCTCNDRGWCLDTNSCRCYPGWTGENCSIATCTNDCHGHGNCSGTTCSCEPGWLPPDCALCNATACNASNYCASGITSLSSNSGSIADHEGMGDYLPNSDCRWDIRPANSNITSVWLEWRAMALVTGSAVVTVYDGAPGSHIIGEYSGLFFSGLPPPIGSTDGEISVEFKSDPSTPTDEGFRASYMGVSCPNHCSDRGHCDINGLCQCAHGFTGESCNSTVCIGDCGASAGRGTCTNDVCICAPGWFGADCAESHCSGTARYTMPSYEVTDHIHGDTYRPNSNCIFEIDPVFGSGETLSLVFHSISLGTDASLEIQNLTEPTVLHRFLGPFAAPVAPLRFSSPIRLVFTTPSSGFTLTGFDVTYSVSSVCDNCSNHATCNAGVCLCDAGWSGPSCSSEPTPIALQQGAAVPATIDGWTWKYFSITLPAYSVQDLFVSVERTVNHGHPVFFLRKGSLPKSQVETDVWSPYFITTQIPVRFPDSNSTYYLGIYNVDSDSDPTHVTLSWTVSCPLACLRSGTCTSNDNVCACLPCYLPPLCETLNATCVPATTAVPVVSTASFPITTSDPTSNSAFVPTASASSTTFATSNPVENKPDDGKAESGQGIGAWVIVIVVLALLAVFGGLAFVLYRRHKKRRAAVIAMQRRVNLQEISHDSSETGSAPPLDDDQYDVSSGESD